MRLTTETDTDSRVDQTLAVHPLTRTGRTQCIDCPLLENAGTNPPEHIGTTAPLEHDIVDAFEIKQLGKQQTGRAGADDRNLSLHGLQVTANKPRLALYLLVRCMYYMPCS